jgi:asparagine synthase (glutamine-hydrolysing)
MCGIAGWANIDADKPPMFGDEVVLQTMCDTMWHRGPDSEGLWLDTGVALGMRRLAIIDLSTGEQPVWNENKSIVAVMNGELYNFQEVRKDLEKRGHKFVSNSDTEIIPHLYEEYGDDFMEQLNGMFTIALWDIAEKKLILTRDRFGEKPLYYGVFGDKMIFASEPKVLLSHASVKPRINMEALRQYLSFDYVPAPLSMYEGISKLPSAHKLIWQNGEAKISRYWKLSFNKSATRPTVTEASAQLGSLLSDSVRMRMISDVPLGILLSGGVDSSAVAAYAVKHSSKRVETFSIGFEEASFDESKYAREVAEHLGTDHYEEKLSVDKAAELVSEIGKWLDEPMSDGSLIPTFLLSRFVRKHVTVALGGDGGDEIFAGYPMYYGLKMARVYDAIPKFVRSALIEPMVRGLPVNTKNLSFDYKAKRFVGAANYDPITRHHAWFGSFTPDQQVRVLSENVKFATRATSPLGIARKLWQDCDAESELERMQYLDMNLYLAEDILTKVDRASMAVSLEVRAPFLDHRVAEFAAGLPPEYKLKGSTGKYILKKAVEDMLPRTVTKRAKKGFGIPIAEWLKGRLNHLLHDLLSTDRLIRQGLFNPGYVQQLIREHEQGIASHHKQLWTLLVFQLWYDNFLDVDKPPRIKKYR